MAKECTHYRKLRREPDVWWFEIMVYPTPQREVWECAVDEFGEPACDYKEYRHPKEFLDVYVQQIHD